MDDVVLILRLLLAGVFVTAATAKLLDFKAARKAMNEFGMPAALCGAASALLILIEFSISFLLILVETSRMAAIGATIILLVFTAAIARLLLAGKSADCSCFGQIQSSPVDSTSLVRNILLVALASFVIFVPESGGDIVGLDNGGSTNLILVFVGFAAWGLLTAAVILGLEARKRSEDLDERLEKVEGTAAFLEKHEEAGDPQEGMPVGSIPGEVSLTDIDGNPTPLKALWSEGKPSLVFLVGPNCAPCEAIAENFAVWGEELSKKANLAIISSGDTDQNIEKFGEVNRSRLYFQEADQAANALGSKWTPTAVLIAADGRIASRPAAGDAEIEKLIQHIRDTRLPAKKPLYLGNPDDHTVKRFGKEIDGFSLNTISGKAFSKDDLVGKNTLAVFWSLTCPHCTEMLDQLKSWRSNGNGLSLAVFADGDIEKLNATGLGESLILDADFEVSKMIGMHGTPSALVIDEKGRVISELVAGAERIRKLGGFERL